MALLDLLRSLVKKPLGVEGLRIYLLLNELLHAIQRQPQTSTKLAEAVAASLLSLSDDSLQIIGTVTVTHVTSTQSLFETLFFCPDAVYLIRIRSNTGDF